MDYEKYFALVVGILLAFLFITHTLRIDWRETWKCFTEHEPQLPPPRDAFLARLCEREVKAKKFLICAAYELERMD
jgi:hypothetical protein